MSFVCAHVLSICTLMSSVCISYVSRMSSVCHWYVLVCHSYVFVSYVIRMYSHVIRMSLVCTCMSSVCHLYVLVFHPYVTCMYLYVILIYSYVIHISLVCGFTMNRFFKKNCIFLLHQKKYLEENVSKPVDEVHQRRWISHLNHFYRKYLCFELRIFFRADQLNWIIKYLTVCLCFGPY